MQYERLTARSSIPPERRFFEHMRTVADMDFLVIMMRRFLRTAEYGRQIPSGNQPQLKMAVKVFYSRWGNLADVRNALEHFDTTLRFPVPAISTPSEGGESQYIFMWPGGNLDINKLFKDAQSIFEALRAVIVPLEAQLDSQE
jgi:hypothetical protein